MDRHKITVEN